MRLEVGDNSPLSRRAVIKVNGEEVRLCTVADTDRGLVVRFQSHEDGRIKHNGDEILRETLTGFVEIIDPETGEVVASGGTA